MLKDAIGTRLRRHALLGAEAVVGDADNLAGRNLAHVRGTDDVQGAGLGSNDPLALAQLSQDERTNAVRVAEGVERVLAREHHGVAALEHAHGVRDAGAKAVAALREVADELGRNLAVGVRAEGDAHLDELAAQGVKVHEGAVVRQRNDHVVDHREVRLGRLPPLGARRAVAAVANCHLAWHSGKVCLGEDLCDQAKVLAHQNGAPVSHRNARRLLPAVLQRPQAKVRHARWVAVGRPHAKDAALVVQLVVTGLRRPRRFRHDATSLLGTHTRMVRP